MTYAGTYLTPTPTPTPTPTHPNRSASTLLVSAHNPALGLTERLPDCEIVGMTMLPSVMRL
jgi:hypothetical protein